MKLSVLNRYITLIFISLSLSCSAHKTQTLKQPPVHPPEASQAAEAEATGQPAETPIIETEAAAPGKKSELAAAGEESDGAPSLPEKIRAEISSIPPAGEIPENEVPFPDEIADAPENSENTETGQQILDSALDLVNSSQGFWAEGNQDQALAALDEAYSLAVRVDTGESLELIQQKDDLRYMISRRILEIYASRFTTTNGNHNEIPVILNEYVEKEIRQFQGPERAFFIRAYQRSGRFMPMILKSLREAGLPEDLAWIPLIESGFNVNALSSARALGLWQFIASTGQKFGLKRDTWIDERMDPEKSTAAAIAYLKELHQIFGDWTTVLAGYNCGEGAVLRKIRNQKINYLDNFWDLFQQLPYETARYVPRFLATLHILKDPVKYGFDLETPDSPVAYETVTITKAVKLSAIAQAIAVPEEELSALNSELRHKSTPSVPYTLRVPEGKSDCTLARIDEIPDWAPPKDTSVAQYGSHTVRKGETLSDIARKYNTTVSRIAQANKIRENAIIRIGQKLKVPQKGATGGSANTASAIKLQPGGKYLVKKGDTLWLVARKFNTDTKKIQQLNKLKDTRLLVGQTLLIPE